MPETYYDADGNPVQVDTPADLRKQLDKRDKELKDLQAQLNSFVEERRKAETETLLKDYNPKVREFVEEFNLDARALVDKYGDLFAGTPSQAPAQTAQESPEQQALRLGFEQLQQTAAGAPPALQDTTVEHQGLLEAAKSGDPADIANYMASLNRPA